MLILIINIRVSYDSCETQNWCSFFLIDEFISVNESLRNLGLGVMGLLASGIGRWFGIEMIASFGGFLLFVIESLIQTCFYAQIDLDRENPCRYCNFNNNSFLYIFNYSDM
jgi:hypothetical protein